MISATGAIIGIIIGVGITLAQQHFGLLKLGSGYVVDAYPVVLQFTDAVLVFVTVVVMGWLAAWYPVRYISRNKAAK